MYLSLDMLLLLNKLVCKLSNCVLYYVYLQTVEAINTYLITVPTYTVKKYDSFMYKSKFYTP